MSYQHIDVKPISGALGAEIYGADLATLTDNAFTEIHDAFLEHQVIFFRDQIITPQQQLNSRPVLPRSVTILF